MGPEMRGDGRREGSQDKTRSKVDGRSRGRMRGTPKVGAGMESSVSVDVMGANG